MAYFTLLTDERPSIVEAMAKLVGSAKDIYRTEPIRYLRIEIQESNSRNSHSQVVIYTEAIDGGYGWDEWNSFWTETLEESEIAKKLLQRIQFKNENVHYTNNYLEFTVKYSPKIKAIEDAIHDLRKGGFYDELHREDEGYTVITKDVRGLRKFQEKHNKVVSIYKEDDFDTLYNVYIS
jgi:hypothetical protein